MSPSHPKVPLRPGGNNVYYAWLRTVSATGVAPLARGSPASPKNEYPPQPKPSAEVPPPRLYQPVREVPELPDVPDLHRRPPFGGAQ